MQRTVHCLVKLSIRIKLVAKYVLICLYCVTQVQRLQQCLLVSVVKIAHRVRSLTLHVILSTFRVDADSGMETIMLIAITNIAVTVR